MQYIVYLEDAPGTDLQPINIGWSGIKAKNACLSQTLSDHVLWYRNSQTLTGSIHNWSGVCVFVFFSQIILMQGSKSIEGASR